MSTRVLANNLKKAYEVIQDSDVVLLTSGAGMGVASGLPDFRGDQGMWKAYPPLAHKGISFVSIANPDAFEADPALAWGFYGHRYDLYKQTMPHKGFHTLLSLVQQKQDYFVLTSNVDGHYQKAGFDPDKVYEVHGRIYKFQCSDMSCSSKPWLPEEDMVLGVDPDTLQMETDLPVCPACGQMARPNVLMFNDYGWDEEESVVQEAAFDSFIEHVHRDRQRLVIVEIGAGTAVPTIRRIGESIMKSVLHSTLIRINPRESQGPRGVISIPQGALTALECILPPPSTPPSS